ncbi:hypothetical conserved protein (plasmid) [Rhizobium etli CFN 42]|uniref:Hypothetical conserved protein n=1 Tax=Rhizobium etli (strain ATCC 51251 / DSM 11541 / JCM 21823 / NBRC 15573 / CFN 42) TaxID=347834 RepID=Q2K2G2_RHIEC|nr:hypothetical conserved protein [Rhizobium etli CFN 42]
MDTEVGLGVVRARQQVIPVHCKPKVLRCRLIAVLLPARESPLRHRRLAAPNPSPAPATAASLASNRPRNCDAAHGRRRYYRANRRFESWAAFEAHLDRWVRDVADQREHGTTGIAPAERFAAEAGALRPLAGRAPFGQLRDLMRKVQADCAIDLDTNSYSVPWRLIGESVQVVVLAGRVIIRHAGHVNAA